MVGARPTAGARAAAGATAAAEARAAAEATAAAPLPSDGANRADGCRARHAEDRPYQVRNATPNQRTACSAQSACWITAPIPVTPATMSTTSESVHTVTMGPTCARRSPWRSTNAFCAPIATIRERPVSRPAREEFSTVQTVGAHGDEGKRKFLMIH